MGRTKPPYIRVTLPYTVAMKKKKKGIRKGECGMKNVFEQMEESGARDPPVRNEKAALPDGLR